MVDEYHYLDTTTAQAGLRCIGNPLKQFVPAPLKILEAKCSHRAIITYSKLLNPFGKVSNEKLCTDHFTSPQNTEFIAIVTIYYNGVVDKGWLGVSLSQHNMVPSMNRPGSMDIMNSTSSIGT